MATENKLRLLNCAVASLDRGEVYVEVGCYKGASLVGAAACNPNARIFACDNFSQFDGAADALRRNLDAHTAPGQVTFHDMDFRDFLAAAPWRPARIGAYFFDGGHSFRDQFDGLALHSLTSPTTPCSSSTIPTSAPLAPPISLRAALPAFELLLDLRTPAQSFIHLVERRAGLSLSPLPRRPRHSIPRRAASPSANLSTMTSLLD